VDATLGNGHDAASLAQCVGPSGHVWGFDVQAAALDSARARLGDHPAFEAIHADHARLAEQLPEEARRRLRAVVFNLGYLPGGDHRVTTTPDSTLKALAAAIEWLADGGVLCCTCYPGHQGGESECHAVLDWFDSLPSHRGALTRIESPNTSAPSPFCLWFELHSSPTPAH
jgi:hypothetical protein